MRHFFHRSFFIVSFKMTAQYVRYLTRQRRKNTTRIWGMIWIRNIRKLKNKSWKRKLVENKCWNSSNSTTWQVWKNIPQRKFLQSINRNTIFFKSKKLNSERRKLKLQIVKRLGLRNSWKRGLQISRACELRISQTQNSGRKSFGRWEPVRTVQEGDELDIKGRAGRG